MSTALKPKIAPVVVEKLDLVRVEKSLHSLGFFASTTSRENSRTIIQIIRRADGQRIQAKAVIEGIPSLGLPTTADRDKYMAFMKTALDQRDIEGQLSNPVRFTGADMIKMLGLRKGGFHYDEINDWCKRMVATTIMSESSIFLADRRQYVSDVFHVFDRVVLVGEELEDGSRSEQYQVHLSQWQLKNLNQGYFLPLDFTAYLKLGRDIAKALFGHLSVWFYASRGQTIEKSYTDLCQVLHIRAYPHVSKARAVLAPSLDELKAIGYLSSWELVHGSGKGEFKLVLTPGDRLLSLPNFSSVVNPEARAALEARLPEWVGEMIKRGVVERKARQLALDLPESQPVMDQLEYADELIARDRKGRGKISNPAGFYVWAVEQNLSVPETFETSHRQRHRESAARAVQQEEVRRMGQELEYDEFCRACVADRVAKDFSGERLDVAVREHLKALKREQPEWFERVCTATRREVAMGRLEGMIRQNLSLPPFSEWIGTRDPQMQMF